MNAIKFDRNRIRGILADANVSTVQTEAVVKAMEDGLRVESTDLATEKGLEDVKQEMELLRRDVLLAISRSQVVGIGITTGILAVMFTAFGFFITLMLGQ